MPVRHSVRLLTLLLATMLAVACKKPDPKACEQYSKKLCEVAGEESSACSSVKDTAELMPPAACSAALADIDKAKTKLADRRKSCDQLITKLCGDLGPETETCEMVKTQAKNIPPDQCTKMMQNYGELVADLKKRESRNQPIPPEKMAVLAKPGAPSFGPEGSKVVLVEFSDFQCPYCSRAATALNQLKDKYKTQVHVVFRQFPLDFHKEAHLAAQASLAAHAQGKFWEFHDKLFADQSKLTRPDLEAAAKAVGLDMAAFNKALDDKTYKAAVDADIKLGGEVSVNGTPTLFMNGKRISDPTNFEAISKAIDAALAKSS